MKRFAELMDRLTYEPSRNGKLRLIADYLRNTEDPERGWALAGLTGALTFKHAKGGMIRALITERCDPVLFALSYDYVGDLSETVALMWPADPAARPNRPPTLSDVVETLSSLGKTQLPAQLARWLDALDETGRWALLKLVTGGLRIGVSARLAKIAAASLGDKEPDEVEIIWPGLTPPYLDLFTWLEGKGERPKATGASFSPAMLSHAIEEHELDALDPNDYAAEWKWDGTRIQAVTAPNSAGDIETRLFSRTGEDISKSFPDLTDVLKKPGAIDGELLILRDGRVQPFNVLQQRLNRKAVTPKMLTEFPAHLRAYDLIAEDGNDLRALPFRERRTRLEKFVGALKSPRVDLSPLVPFKTWPALVSARA
ncbi:MAG: cisplatin damage response ATP-dependent DNA ligase, partial [Pseudolabrys sp.]|nr:cisplatin damage response ATP-dependent DNA ligase [Pseudolabrys sp.]